MKRRRPDLMVVLALLVGLGFLATGLSQAIMNDRPAQVQARK